MTIKKFIKKYEVKAMHLFVALDKLGTFIQLRNRLVINIDTSNSKYCR
jgi:hypothetical protein